MDTICFDNFNGSFYIMLLYRQRYALADVMPKNVVVDVKPLRMLYLFCVMADVIAMMSLWQMFKPLTVEHIIWQMLLPMWQMEQPL